MIHPFRDLALGLLASIATWYGAAFTVHSFLRPTDSLAGILYVLIVLSMAAGVGSWVLFALRKRAAWTWPNVPRPVAWGLVGSYLITWVFGIPATETRDTRLTIARWSHNKALGREVHDSPTVQDVAALPIAPGLILSYHAFVTGPLDGWEGWTLHLWYGWGVIELYDLTLTVS
jgi:hypothetical protein